jgi:hypothetical protein
MTEQLYLEELQKMKRLMFGFAAFQAYVGAAKLNLFGVLADAPGLDRAELARRLGISEHPARVLLLACCTYGLVERRDGRYYNTTMAELFLTPKSLFPILAFTKYCDVVQYKAFQYLAESLKSESNVGVQTLPGSGNCLYKRLAESPELERIFQDGMAPKDRDARELLFDTGEFREVRHLLDVGGGPGLIDSLLKTEFPQLAITLFDLPTVCERAKAIFEERGLTGLTTKPGDFFRDPFPTGADAILFSHLLEIFSEEKILSLLSKAFEALPKNGRVFIYGMACDDDEIGGDMAAWGSLYFYVLASGEGMMYPVGDYRRWLKAVGFSSVVERRNQFENMLLIATK